MAQPWSKRLKHAWNAFVTPEERRRLEPMTQDYGASSGAQQYRSRPSFANGRTIVSSIYNRIAIDVAGVAIRHVRTDDQDRFLEEIDSGLNECFKIAANIDQKARAFRQDIMMTLFERGVAVIVPVDTTLDPRYSGGFDIKTMRVGYVTQWYARHVRISLYNDRTGMREELTLPKTTVAIIENPLYTVMNEPNSTLQRLTTKLSQLDEVDAKSSSDKLDLIIQLPYAVKNDSRRADANRRRTEMETQLTASKYGIAYADATEKITQLNRPVENRLLEQVDRLTTMLYGQLGLTEEIMNGTADEKTMLNYWIRTIEPLLDATVESMRFSFLTKTARSQRQNILYFRDPFKLIPIGGEGGIADIADKLARNEIASSNELRGVLGWKPADDPKADELRNSNMPQGTDPSLPPGDATPAADPLDAIDQELTKLLEAGNASS